MNKKIKLPFIFSWLFAFSTSGCALELKQDEVLNKLLDWHIGFATNQAQYDADKDARIKPAWALSELRLTKIWPEREDGHWVYYEVSQPQVRPDRNEIWKLYRSELGDLKVDVYRFNDIERGLTFWGKWNTPDIFEEISLDELTTVAGCNGTYHWLPESNKFSGINSHHDCPVGNGYILQHIEISEDSNGDLQRNDWHWFFNGEGVAKTGPEFKLGNMGPYIHKYVKQ
ncbi:MAG: hypothetical protein KTR16_10585 [Acidiferrobacterales bacterium]|nr:hypothetical protein [Acidiferrobacterales bacterium]